jgi:dolichyl-diphosphooligosaccharide--protein glycosyltransferase
MAERKNQLTLQKLKPILILIALLIPLLLSTSIRLNTLELPFATQLAEQNIDNYFKQNIQAQVNKENPLMPDSQKQALIQEGLEKMKSQNNAMYESQVKQVASDIKDAFQDDDGRTYIFAIDSYYYLRQVRNILETGTPYDELRNNTPYNTYMLAPFGREMPTTGYLHSYFGAYLTKATQTLGFSYSYKDVFFVLPVIVAGAAIIFVFLLLQKTLGTTSAFIGSLYLGISPVFLSRTIGGFSDTDAYTLFFPLLIGYFVVQSIFSKSKSGAAINGALAAIGFGLFAQAWTGWWYAMLIMVFAVLGYTAIILLRGNIKTLTKNIKENVSFARSPQLKNIAYGGGAFVLMFAILAFIVFEPSLLVKPLLAPINYLSSIKEATNPNLWPNVYTTVAELGDINLNTIIQSLGGRLYLLFILISLGSLAYLLYSMFHKQATEDTLYEHTYTKKGKTLFIGILGFVWLVGTVFTALRGGTRFSMLVVPAYAILLGLSAYFLREITQVILTKIGDIDIEISKKVAAVVVIVLLLLVIRPNYTNAVSISQNQRPMMTDAWNDALTSINENAAPDAIINSWWDYGHWFKAIGNRSVTFDGASQNSPRAHWIGKVLQTDDPEVARGILRMLDCSGNTAYEYINERMDRQIHSIELLYKIVPASKTQAEQILQNYSEHTFSASEIEAILTKTHCQPPENYFITSGDMVGKAGVWAHFGLWNFTKADIWLRSKNLSDTALQEYMSKEHDIAENEQVKILRKVNSLSTEREANDWISPWPSYGGVIPCSYQNATQRSFLTCQQIVVDTEKQVVTIPGRTGNRERPVSYVYVENGTLREKEFENTGAFPYSVVLHEPENAQPEIIVSQPEIAASMFTRLYYLDGKGQDVFTKYTQEQNIGGGKIIVWKTQW